MDERNGLEHETKRRLGETGRKGGENGGLDGTSCGR